MNALEQSVFRALLSAALACTVSCGRSAPSPVSKGPDAASKDFAQWEALRHSLEPSFDQVNIFSEGRAAVRRGVNWGYVDETGKPITRLIFAEAEDFSEGLAVVKIDSKYGYIDRSGAIAIPPRFSRAGRFQESLADASLGDVREDLKNGYIEKYGYIDKTGAFVIPQRYDSAFSFSEGFAAVKIKGRWGFIDKSGKFLVQPRFEQVTWFTDGLAPVKTSAGWGFIDLTGNVVVQPQFEELGGGIFMGVFSEDSLPVMGKGEDSIGEWGYIDRTGKFFIKPRFEKAEPFKNGIARVQTYTESGCINKSGESVACP